MAAINLGMPKVPETLAPRRKSRQIKVGKVLVGGDAPVSVQSMTTTPTPTPPTSSWRVFRRGASTGGGAAGMPRLTGIAMPASIP